MRKKSVFLYVLIGLLAAGALAVAVSMFSDPEKNDVKNSYVTPGTVETGIETTATPELEDL